MQVTPFCLPQTSCSSPLLGSETCPLPSLISLLVKNLPKVQEPFLWFPPWGANPILIPSFSFCLTCLCEGFIVFLRSSVSTQQLFCVNHSSCRCIFNVSVEKGELCFSPLSSWSRPKLALIYWKLSQTPQTWKTLGFISMFLRFIWILKLLFFLGLLRWLSAKESTCQGRSHRCRLYLWVGKILQRRKWEPAPVFLLG